MRLRFKSKARLTYSFPFLLLACTVLIIGGGFLTAAAYVFTQQRATRLTNAKFEEVTGDHVHELLHHLESYSGLLYATRGLFASTNVDAETWSSFIHAQNAPSRYQGMKAVAYAEVVPENTIDSYLQTLRQGHGQSISIHPEKTEDDYTVLTYHEEVELPDAQRLNAIGFDLSSSTVRSKALEQARATGAMAATGRLELITTGKPGFLMVLPLTDKFGAPSQQPTPFGYGIAAFEIEELVEKTIGSRLERYQTSIHIADVTEGQPTPLYSKELPSWNRTIKRDLSLEVADRTWRITLEVPTGNLVTTVERLAPTFVLVVGVGFMGSLCILIYALRARYQLQCTVPPNR
jgi:CHASE1-domain containing sensor protein